MIKCSLPNPEFHLVGTASKFILKKKGKVKGFELETPQGNFYFKIPHKLHEKLNCRLYPNVKLEVQGIVKVCPKKAKIKLKLKHIKVLSNNPSPLPFDLKSLKTPENTIALESSATPESNPAL